MRVVGIGTERSYRDHLAPIGEALAGAGDEYVLMRKADDVPRIHADVIVTAAARDLNLTRRRRARRVVMEHGTGLQFYPDWQIRLLGQANAIAAPNEFVAGLYREALPSAWIEVVGTPKLDALMRTPARVRPLDAAATVAISFHWSGTSNISRPVWQRYRSAIAELADRYEVIGHGHPKVWGRLQRAWRELGIEPVRTFAEVVSRADLYACDHSSTIFEFAALGRPVVMLEGHRGAVPASTALRYEQHSDIGLHATPRDLVEVAIEALEHDEHTAARADATAQLYPYLGEATPRALEVIRQVAAGDERRLG